MIRFVIGALDETGLRRVAVRELSSLRTPIPEVEDAGIVADSAPALSSPTPGLIRLSLELQGTKLWRTSFDVVPLDDDGRVRVVAVGREARADGTTGAEFRRELGGWFLVYSDGALAPPPDPEKQRGAFADR